MIHFIYVRRQSDPIEAARPYNLYEYSIADAIVNYCSEMECDVSDLKVYFSISHKIDLEDYIDGIQNFCD